MMKQCAEGGVALGVIPAFQHPVHGVVKIFARRSQAASLKILLAGSELLLNFLDQISFSIRNGRQQRLRLGPCWIGHRQGCERYRCLSLLRGLGAGRRWGVKYGRHSGRCRVTSLHRLPGCVFAAKADGGHHDCAYCQEHPSLHLYYGKERVAPGSTVLIP